MIDKDMINIMTKIVAAQEMIKTATAAAAGYRKREEDERTSAKYWEADVKKHGLEMDQLQLELQKIMNGLPADIPVEEPVEEPDLIQLGREG